MKKIDIKLNNLLNEFANKHNTLQLECYSLSSIANNLGYPGASKWFQVQAQDEVLHTRKIYNYLMDRDEQIIVKTNNVKAYDNLQTLEELITTYKNIKLDFLKFTYDIIEVAKTLQDHLTIKFLDWFLIDFYEEIAEAKDYLDMLKMCNKNYYVIDKRLAKRTEPDTLKVIIPYSQK